MGKNWSDINVAATPNIIFNNAQSITVDRRKVVGTQYTRNEIARTSVTPTLQPWRFVIEMPNSLPYNIARPLLEEVDRLDRWAPFQVLVSKPEFKWFFRYQGDMTPAQISAITVQSYVGNVLTLTNLPAIAPSAYLFYRNDLIDIGNEQHPFTASEGVTRGTGSTVTVYTSRPNIFTSSVVGKGINVGTDCAFNMFCPNMPTYKLMPGARAYNGSTLVNNAMIEWSDSFTFYEYLGDI